MVFFDERGGTRFKNGRIVFCHPDSQVSAEWAPYLFSTACKAGEELKVIKLDGNGGGCPADVFSFFDSVDGPCVALFQDWAGATYFSAVKE